jgi:hypothetical protein
MCEECLTKEIRLLVPGRMIEPGLNWYYTLRAGFASVLVVGPMEIVARFDFIELEDGTATAQLVVVDPIDWVHFLPALAEHLGQTEEDYYDLLDQLEAEAAQHWPRVKADLATLDDE